ncbi:MULTISPECIES: type II toxin-antitoxin system RelB family antitoxin [Deferrisoma]
MNIEIPEPIRRRLAALAAQFGKTETACVVEALQEWVEDREDYLAAAERLKCPGRRLTTEELERELGLAD